MGQMLVNIPYMDPMGFVEKKNWGDVSQKTWLWSFTMGTWENPSSFMAHFDANIPQSGDQWDQ